MAILQYKLCVIVVKPENKKRNRSEEVLPTSPSPISGIVLIMTLILAIAFIAMDYKDIGAWPE